MTRKPWIKLAVVIVGIALFVAAVNYLTSPAIGWPDEARRVKHPAGFSIVAPQDWDSTVTLYRPSGRPTADALQFTPASVKGMPPSFSATRLTVPLSEAGLRAKNFRPRSFQGKPAMAFEEQRGKLFLRSVVFERDGEWYELVAQLQLPESVEEGVWGAYFDSFRIEKRFTPATLRLPASTPAITSGVE